MPAYRGSLRPRPAWFSPRAPRPYLRREALSDRALLPPGHVGDLVGRGAVRALARSRARGARRVGRDRHRSARGGRCHPRDRGGAGARTDRRARSPYPPRRRRLRRCGRRAARRGGPLVSLRTDLVRRSRHRVVAAASRGGRADPRRTRARARRCHRAGRGAPADDHDRPYARGPRGADDVRPQARRLGVRAGARSRARHARSGRDPRRASFPAQSGPTPLRIPRSSASPASASGSSRRRARPRSSSAIATRRC